MPVSQLILERLPNTLLLMVSALGMALVLGIVPGWIMAVLAGRWPDRVLQVVVLLLYSTPGFWVGLMAIVLFSVKLGWLPSNGSETVGVRSAGLRLLAGPGIVSGAAGAGAVVVLRRGLCAADPRLDAGGAAARTSCAPRRPKACTRSLMQLRHALRNALIPVTTVAGIHLGNLLGGAVVVETVFGWPGMGRLALEAVIGARLQRAAGRAAAVVAAGDRCQRRRSTCCMPGSIRASGDADMDALDHEQVPAIGSSRSRPAQRHRLLRAFLRNPVVPGRRR